MSGGSFPNKTSIDSTFYRTYSLQCGKVFEWHIISESTQIIASEIPAKKPLRFKAAIGVNQYLKCTMLAGLDRNCRTK